MKVYYNDFDKDACRWLRALMADGHLPEGTVDERSIRDVKAADLVGYDRVDLFSGIGGWQHALALAGWPCGVSLWSGSCPCQPFSSAGKRKAQADDRHLWPEMFRLIRECRPAIVIGEQVQGAVRHGWLDGVFADLEGEGYSCGALVLGAHSVGAPHIRQRIFWVAVGDGHPRQRGAGGFSGEEEAVDSAWLADGSLAHRSPDGGEAHGLADAELNGESRRHSGEPREGDGAPPAGAPVEPGRRGLPCGLGQPASDGRRGQRLPDGRSSEAAGAGVGGGWLGWPRHPRLEVGVGDGGVQREAGRPPQRQASELRGDAGGGVGDADRSRADLRPEKGSPRDSACESGSGNVGLANSDGRLSGDGGLQRGGQHGQQPQDRRLDLWRDYVLIPCRDGKFRRTQPGLRPLAPRISQGMGRVGRLRGYGNSISPPVAAAFLAAVMQTLGIEPEFPSSETQQ